MKVGTTYKKLFTFIPVLIVQTLNMADSSAQTSKLPQNNVINSARKSFALSNISEYHLDGTVRENMEKHLMDELNPVISSWSLKKCYEIAIENSVALKQEQNNIRSGIIDRKITRNSFLPSVSYNMGHYFSFGKNIDPVTNAFSYESFSGGYTALGLQLELFSGFKKLNSIKESTFRIKASGYNKEKVELELLTNITLTYARLSLDKEEISNVRNVIANTVKELNVINEKIRVGRLSKYEFYTFNARLNTQQADLITLQNDSLNTLQDLRQLLNISYKEKFDIVSIDDAVLPAICATDFSEDELVTSVLLFHPAIKQAEVIEQAARVQVKIERGNFLPSVFVGGNVVSNYNSDQKNTNGGKIPLAVQLNNNLGKNINIGISVPVFSQIENVNRMKKEKINVSNATMEIDDIKNSVTNNVLHLINDFNSAKEKYKSTLAAFEQNNLSYSLYLEKYGLGQVSSVELITAQEILNTSASQYLESRLQLYFRFQLIELLKNCCAQ